MIPSSTLLRPAALCAAGMAGVAGLAPAQTGLIQGATIVAHVGGPVPDASGTAIPGSIFGGTANEFSNPTVSEAGNVVFRAVIEPITVGQGFAWFHGTGTGPLVMVLREGDPVPGLTGGETLGDNTTGGLNPNCIISPIGTLLLNGRMTGPTVTTSNDSVWLGGTPGAMTLYLREGMPAPGTSGAVLGNLSGSPFNVGLNRNNHMYFKNTLVGGDVVGTTNDEAWYAGAPGALELVVREGDIVGGAPIATMGTAVSQMNDSGQFLYQVSLSTTTGSPPATSANDSVTLLHTPGAGSTIVVREGDVAPGTSGGVFFGQPGFSPNAFTSSGRLAFTAAIVGGDVVGTTNDVAIFTRAAGTLSLAVREGTIAPGTAAAEFANFNANHLRIQDDGSLLFLATLRNGDVTTGVNDEAVYAGMPGALQLVVRRGQVAPGSGGSTFGSFALGPYYRNDQGRVVFTNTLISNGAGSPAGKSWWYFDPTAGVLECIWLPGEALTVGGIPDFVTDFTTYSALNNTDSASLPFSHDGDLAGVMTLLSGRKAVVKLRVQLPAPVPYCFGDGSGTACPCGNSGAAGNGCANSIVPAGARIAGTGTTRLANDTLILAGMGMPNSSALYFQGTTEQSGGLGSPFGDGLRCAAGTTVRLKTVTNVAGMSQYPEPGDLPVSLRGLVTSPGTRTYQVWYRNAAAFCTSATFNLSNGLRVEWTL